MLSPCSCVTVPSGFWGAEGCGGTQVSPWPWAAVCTGMAARPGPHPWGAWLGQRLGLLAPRVSRRKPGARAALICGEGCGDKLHEGSGQPSPRPWQHRHTEAWDQWLQEMHVCSQWGKEQCLAVGPAGHFLLCPHVLRPREALSGSVWTSPLWLSHVQGLLWDRSGWRVGLSQPRNAFRRWVRTHIFLWSFSGLTELTPALQGDTQKQDLPLAARPRVNVSVWIPCQLESLSFHGFKPKPLTGLDHLSGVGQWGACIHDNPGALWQLSMGHRPPFWWEPEQRWALVRGPWGARARGGRKVRGFVLAGERKGAVSAWWTWPSHVTLLRGLYFSCMSGHVLGSEARLTIASWALPSHVWLMDPVLWEPQSQETGVHREGRWGKKFLGLERLISPAGVVFPLCHLWVLINYMKLVYKMPQNIYASSWPAMLSWTERAQNVMQLNFCWFGKATLGCQGWPGLDVWGVGWPGSYPTGLVTAGLPQGPGRQTPKVWTNLSHARLPGKRTHKFHGILERISNSKGITDFQRTGTEKITQKPCETKFSLFKMT